MDDRPDSVYEALRHASLAATAGRRFLQAGDTAERNGDWAQDLAGRVRAGREALRLLRTTFRTQVAPHEDAQAEQLDAALRELGWHAKVNGCLLLPGEDLPGD